MAENSSSGRMAKRAQMVLMCIAGKQIKDIAQELHERPNTVIFWRDRFVASGVSSLFNLPRGRQKVRYGELFKSRMLQKLEDPPPDGHKRWTGKLLSTELGESTDTIWRYLRKSGVRLVDYQHQTKEIPFEYTLNLSLDLTFKKDNIMKPEENTNAKSDIELIARIKKSDGTVIEKVVTMEKALVDIDDFDFGTREGFFRDLGVFENSMREARDQLMKEIGQSYLSSSKKNGRRKQ